LGIEIALDRPERAGLEPVRKRIDRNQIIFDSALGNPGTFFNAALKLKIIIFFINIPLRGSCGAHFLFVGKVFLFSLNPAFPHFFI
jgi:hypothetical protein